ncbi:hypothetical protein ABZX95_08655 [Streptomyces sp. NPDC004232]|uniref:hypothetical protein n=1 Tax=Streptomyces sp. NPDC004232 TaxID=3154454 RepID=UPI0033A8126E
MPEPNLLERPYEIAGMPARLFTFTDGEYVRVENHGAALSIGWSTTLPIDEASNLFRRKLKYKLREAREEGQPLLGIVSLPGEAPKELTSPKEALDYAEENSGDVEAVFISFHSLIFSWLSCNPNAGSGGKFLQIAVSLEEYDRRTLEVFLSSSGTPKVRLRAADIAARANPMHWGDSH